MWGGLAHRLARALVSACGAAAALALLALLIGAGAYRLTISDGTPRVVSRLSAAEPTHAFAAPRPQPLITPRARPAAEPEARDRIVPAAPPEIDVRSLARALSIADEPPPALSPGDRATVALSFYYCEHSAGTPRGDGGGFCGVMRDGSSVYPGAAACHVAYLGQLFRIEGDPAGLIYRCADTGSAIGAQHRDIWFETSDEGWRWQLGIGRTAAIQILP